MYANDGFFPAVERDGSEDRGVRSGKGRAVKVQLEKRKRRMDPEVSRRIDGMTKAYFEELMHGQETNPRLEELVRTLKS